jgi:hypothetical protein
VAKLPEKAVSSAQKAVFAAGEPSSGVLHFNKAEIFLKSTRAYKCMGQQYIGPSFH